MTEYTTTAEASVSVKGVLHFHDADGNLVGTTELDGKIPLDRDTAAQIIEGETNGELRK